MNLLFMTDPLTKTTLSRCPIHTTGLSRVLRNWTRKKKRHMNAFYALLKKWMRGKEYTSTLMNKEDYNARVYFLLRVREGVIDCREGYLTGNINAYKWLKRYHVYKYADDSVVLVLRPIPKKSGAVDVTAIQLDRLQQPTC